MQIKSKKWQACLVALSFLLIGTATHLEAQEYGMESLFDGYNRNSVAHKRIHNSHKLYQKTLWFQIDLKEKQNKPFMARGRELPTLIIEAAKNGIIRPYASDSLRTRLNDETFKNNLKLPGADEGLTDEEIAMGFGDAGGGGWGDDGGSGWGDEGGWGDDGGGGDEGMDEFFPRDFSVMRVREDLFFDKVRSRMIHDIQSLEIILPAEKNADGGGIDKTIGVFSYKELVDNLFKGNPEAIWYNPHNSSPNSHRNLEEAFELRLFTGHVVKYDNPDDAYIIDMTQNDEKQKIISSMNYEYQLIEYESHLWEN
ncbi:MAG: gliding motility protein GldN [Bernardetiaceae bacterium]|nr:gliding motility protein GldN [Bernardetiaceae bacterium]